LSGFVAFWVGWEQRTAQAFRHWRASRRNKWGLTRLVDCNRIGSEIVIEGNVLAEDHNNVLDVPGRLYMQRYHQNPSGWTCRPNRPREKPGVKERLPEDCGPRFHLYSSQMHLLNRRIFRHELL
jgi:hypothetical protein